MTDQMFLVILFAVFAVCAFSLSMIGANIYSHTASVMNEDYEERIDISYVTEKIRQWDEKDSIEIGSFHGRTALIHTEKINGKKYNTYLYQEKGALRELMVREGLDTTTMQGEKIVAVKDFSVIETKQLYHIKIQGSDGKIYLCYVLGGVIRLAYFNVTEEQRQAHSSSRRKHYQGLPITSVALIIPIVYQLRRFFPEEFPYIYVAMLAVIAFLFVFDFKVFKPDKKCMLAFVVIGALIAVKMFLL